METRLFFGGRKGCEGSHFGNQDPSSGFFAGGLETVERFRARITASRG